MKNKLIVESKNDKDFIEALIKDIQLEQTDVDFPKCAIDDYACMYGLNEDKLKSYLATTKQEAKKGLQKVGILIDQDQFTKEERLNFVSKAATKVFEQEIVFGQINTFYKIQIDADNSIEIACHFTNVDGKGELETLLKAIKTEDSPHADCLNVWKTCIETRGQSITQKEFDKMWMSNYLRLDTCSSSKFRGNKGKYCSMDALDEVLKREKKIFNLKATELNDIRAFLNLFK